MVLLRVPQVVVMTKQEFHAYVRQQLGGGVVGSERFAEIMQAARASSVNLVFDALTEYDAAKRFRVEKVQAFLWAITTDPANPITIFEHDAITQNWPGA